jgi:hypothetical protein
MPERPVEPLLYPIREPDAPRNLVPLALVAERGKDTGNFGVWLPNGYRFADMKEDDENGLPPGKPLQWIADTVREAVQWFRRMPADDS